MPLFTFYPYRSDGPSSAIETHEHADDRDALRRARRVLDDHASAVEVVVWHGERRVGAVDRVTGHA